MPNSHHTASIATRTCANFMSRPDQVVLGMLSKVGSQVPDFGNDTKAQLAFFQHMESVAASALQSLDTREDVSSIIKRMNDGTPAGAIASKVCASADDIKLLWAMLSLQNAAVA